MQKLLNNMRKASKNEELKILTVSDAKKLKGKRIQTIYFGYNGQDGVNDFIVGSIISEWELSKFEKLDNNFKNRQDYWKSYMNSDEIKNTKNKFQILTSDDKETYIYTDNYSNECFYCSDTDRFVKYRLCDE